MPFTWEMPGTKNPAWKIFGDGERRALVAVRTRNNPAGLGRREIRHQLALIWVGTLDPLGALAGYERITSGLCRLNPKRASIWNSAIMAEVGFNFVKKDPIDESLDGEERLAFYREPLPMERITEMMRRHMGDWGNVEIATKGSDWALRMCTTNAPGDEIEYLFGEFDSEPTKLPIDDLAAVIEDSDPKTCRWSESGQDLAEIRYDPWPLSHDELVAGLGELEQIWAEKPLSRRQLAVARKNMQSCE